MGVVSSFKIDSSLEKDLEFPGPAGSGKRTNGVGVKVCTDASTYIVGVYESPYYVSVKLTALGLSLLRYLLIKLLDEDPNFKG